MANITCGDNTAAFGGSWLTISLVNESGIEVTVSKAVFSCAGIHLEFENPVFPLTINLNEEQTAKLQCQNTCYLAVWDEDGRKKTCTGSFSFNASPRKV